MTKTEQRGLSPSFMAELKEGFLEPILRLVKSDSTLGMSLRRNEVTVYYRSGRLMHIKETGPGCYSVDFNADYEKGYGSRSDHLPKPDFDCLRAHARVAEQAGVSAWLQQTPLLKFAIDLYLTGKHEREPGASARPRCGGTEQLEGEYQQLVERANNSDPSSDYFILDTEYCVGGRGFQLDMIALHWPAVGRRQRKKQRLSVVEMKYRKNAITGKCGLCDHMASLRDALSRGKLTGAG